MGPRAARPMPKAVERAARESMAGHVRAMLAFHGDGVPTFDYGNNIRQMAKEEGVADAFAFPGFVPPISGPCSAGASARSAGPRSRGTRRTSTGPTPRSRS